MNGSTKFDLEDRTAKFAETVLKFCRGLKLDEINRPIVNQLVRACTSIGANYCEADDAESRKDFAHKIKICKKEARETKYWLKMLIVTNPDCVEELNTFWQEAKELNLIFNAIINSTETKKLVIDKL